MAVESGRVSIPASRSRAFLKARRHSRWVRLAKWAIPFGALFGLSVVILIVIYDPFRNIKGLTLDAVSVSGTQVTMESPRLTGYRNDTRPYEVTATAATQDVRKPHLVELKNMRARLATDDKGNTARLEATTGMLDTQKEQMQLNTDVRVRTDAGQEMQLRSAFIDFKAGSVVSNEPVKVSLGNGTIEAEGINVTDNGKVIQFTGRVRSVFENPNTAKPDSGASAAGATPSPQPSKARP